MSNGMTREIQFVSGQLVDVDNVNNSEYSIYDIAHSLSMLCRYTGHCERFYSVAQHSVLVSQNIEPEFAMAGLLHDMAESVIGDVASPVKKDMPGLIEVENKILTDMAERFGCVTFEQLTSKEVKEADYRMLATEKRDIMKGEIAWPFIEANNIQPFSIPAIEPLLPKQAYGLFLDRYFELLNKIESKV